MSLLRKLLKPFIIVAPYVFRNSQTVAYPDERLVFSDRFRGRHKLHFDRCISCGTCARVCPSNSITLVEAEGWEGTYPQIDYGTCSLCGYCVEFCPKEALEFTDLVEFSTRDRGELVYSPERLAEVPPIKEVLPRLKRRIEPYLTEKEMKYRKVEEL
ncbi:MAG: NuoI/complex I 23 kDa subunit family protein [Candidatus Bathyarchaeia archaeon]